MGVFMFTPTKAAATGLFYLSLLNLLPLIELFLLNNPMTKSQIEKKLAKLSKLLTKIDEAHIINSDDSDTWDSDTLYNLVENLKEALKLLEDQESEKEKDNFGNPLILAEGLCSLMDEYQEGKEENYD